MPTTSKAKPSSRRSGTSGTPKKARARRKSAAQKAREAEEARVAAEVKPPLVESWMPTFLEFLIEGGHVAGACRAANIGRSTAYRHRQKDEAFAVAWADAEEYSTERLEEEAYRRAHDGLVRNKYDKDGNLLQEELVYSDTLMIFLLKARRPDKYRERFDVNHSGRVDGDPMRPDLSKLDLDEARDLQRLLTKAKPDPVPA
jgi:hypothetical protein